MTYQRRQRGCPAFVLFLKKKNAFYNKDYKIKTVSYLPRETFRCIIAAIQLYQLNALSEKKKHHKTKICQKLSFKINLR